MRKKVTIDAAGAAKPTPEEIKNRNQEIYGSKIKRFRAQAGLTAEQLADALGVSKGSIWNWECGIACPDPITLYRMFGIFDVEPNEFFGINGVGALLTTDERSLVDSYRELDRRSKNDLKLFAESLASRAYQRRLYSAFNSITAKSTMGRTAAAGTVAMEWEDHPESEQVYLYVSPEVSRADEIITVSGDSMEPKFSNGDRVLVEYCSEIQNGDIGVFFVPGIGGVIKQKAYDRLHSLNPEYDDIFPFEEGAQLVGKVLGKIDSSMNPNKEQIKLYMEAEAERRKNPEAFDSFND